MRCQRRHEPTGTGRFRPTTVLLDNLFRDVWYDHVAGRPAYKHLSEAELQAAIDIADRMLTEGKPVVTDLNENSLRWRTDR